MIVSDEPGLECSVSCTSLSSHWDLFPLRKSLSFCLILYFAELWRHLAQLWRKPYYWIYFLTSVSRDLPPWQIRGCWSISKSHGSPFCLKHFLEEFLLMSSHQNSLVSASQFSWAWFQSQPAESSIKSCLTLVLHNKYWLLLVTFLLLENPPSCLSDSTYLSLIDSHSLLPKLQGPMIPEYPPALQHMSYL